MTVAREAGCAIDIAHHTTKSDTTSGMATAMSARGAGSFIAACRSVQVLNPMLPDEATKAGLASPVGYFSSYGDKQNLTPKTGNRDWYKMESVDLGNAGGGNLAFMRADNIGVVTRWDWPTNASFTEDVTGEQLRAILNRLKIGSHRKDSQAKGWAGFVVGELLGLGSTKETMNGGDKQRISRMLDVWIEAEELEVYSAQDERRKNVQFVRTK